MKIYLHDKTAPRWQYLNAKGEAYHKTHPTDTLIYWYARVSPDNSVDQIVCCNGLSLNEFKELYKMGFMTHEEHFNMFIRK